MRAAVFLTIVAGLLVADAYQFRCDYRRVPAGGGWIKFHDVPADWHEARLRCHLEGAKLASPLDEGLRNVLRSFRPATKAGVYTGIHATFSRGDYHSVEGIPLWKIPHKWAPNEPNNDKNDESCLLMTSEGELADVNCAEALPYLCYRKIEDRRINNCGTIDNEYTLDSRTGSCYKFHRVPRTWSRAYMTCAAEGGHLAIINSDTEAQVIKDIFAKNPAQNMLGNFWKDVAFVGFHDWKEHGDWLTIEGQTLEEAGYARFSAGEPNNATGPHPYTGGEYCGAVLRSAQLDDRCCDKPSAFVCEKDPGSLLTCSQQ